jgi:surface carbohydrate biosynthesis protein
LNESAGLRRRVALILDHPRRDLPGLVLLARELCRRGVTCHLVPLNNQEVELFSLAPDFVLLNFARLGTERLANRLFEANIDFGLGDTEGAFVSGRNTNEAKGVDNLLDDYTELLWQDHALLRRLAVACMWGPKLADHLVNGGWFTRHQLVVTGCPRFDFYHPRWRGVFDEGEGAGRDVPARILLNTWYAFSNSQMVPTANIVKQMKETFSWSERFILEYIEREEGAIRGFMDLARRLSVDFPTVEILLRPHPFESEEVYRKALAGLENVRVDGSGPVQGQIFRASVLIARSCTTAVEGALAGVPTFSPQWIPTPYVNPISEAASSPCGEYSELRTRVEEVLAGRFRTSPQVGEAVRRVISDWFYQNDGLAYGRVADAIVSRLDGPRRVNEGLCAQFREASAIERRGKVGVGKAVRRVFGVSPEWSFRKMRRIPSRRAAVKYFGVPDVQRLLDKLSLVSGERGDRAPKPIVRLAGSATVSEGERTARSLTLEPG